MITGPKRMKIAAFHNLPFGGAKRALYGFIKYLSRSGHVVDVFMPDTADDTYLPLSSFARRRRVFPLRTTFINSAIRYVRPSTKGLLNFAGLERTHEEIAQAINAGDYDVVLLEHDKYVQSPYLLKFLDRPTVYYCQEPLRKEAIVERLQERVKRPLLKRLLNEYLVKRISEIDRQNAAFAKQILTNSCFSRESILRSYGLNSFVSYLGIDTEIFRPIASPEGGFVLSVGACGSWKGFDFLIKSLSYVERKIRPRLVIVSNGIDTGWKSYLEVLASQVGVEFEVKSLIDDDELVLLLNQAKLFVYAAYLEPFGLAPVEAMACGRAVVAVREGGVRESVIDQETGILTERDERMFAEAVTSLLLDESRRHRLGQCAAEWVQSFWTLRHAGERLVSNLRRLTGVDGTHAAT